MVLTNTLLGSSRHHGKYRRREGGPQGATGEGRDVYKLSTKEKTSTEKLRGNIRGQEGGTGIELNGENESLSHGSRNKAEGK